MLRLTLLHKEASDYTRVDFCVETEMAVRNGDLALVMSMFFKENEAVVKISSFSIFAENL